MAQDHHWCSQPSVRGDLRTHETLFEHRTFVFHLASVMSVKAIDISRKWALCCAALVAVFHAMEQDTTSFVRTDVPSKNGNSATAASWRDCVVCLH